MAVKFPAAALDFAGMAAMLKATAGDLTDMAVDITAVDLNNKAVAVEFSGTA